MLRRHWPELLAYVDSAYVRRFGRHYAWSTLARKNLWNLARVHSVWGVMTLWDLYLAGDSWWARQSRWSVYGMICDAGRLMDDSFQAARSQTRGRPGEAAFWPICRGGRYLQPVI